MMGIAQPTREEQNRKGCDKMAVRNRQNQQSDHKNESLLKKLTKMSTVSLILGVMSWPHVALVLRSQTLQLKSAPYIQTIRAMGAGNGYIILRHLLRELRPLLLYWTVSRMKTGILMESSLSFLGLGNPVAKSWGSMIYYAEAKNAIITGAWLWWVVPPGLCICLVCLALMMISYGLEETGGERRQSR